MPLPTLARDLKATFNLLKKASLPAFYFSLAANVLVSLAPGALVYIGAQLIERISGGHTIGKHPVSTV